MLNLASIIEYNGREYPEKSALIFAETQISYQALAENVNRIATGLAGLGIEKADKVAISCPNIPYFPMVYFAILRLGAVVVPLNILLKHDEIQYHLNDADVAAYVCFEGNAALPMLQQARLAFEQSPKCKHFIVITAQADATVDIGDAISLAQLMSTQAAPKSMQVTQAEDTAVILYTSGTTGHAKGAELTHNNIMMNAMSVMQLFNATAEDVHLISLPLFHSFGQVVQMVSGLLSANTLILLPKFDPDQVFTAMEKYGVSIFCGVPTMYWALLNVKDAASKFDLKKIAKTLRLGVSGGSAMPVEIMQQFSKQFDIQILEGYGLSETSPVATFNKIHREPRPGSVGTPLLGVDVIVADDSGKPLQQGEVGEVLIRGHNVMKSYYNRPEDTAVALKDGWFHSGDLGKFDADGYLYIIDRLKDMIIRGGLNVYPRELEETMIQHDAVSLVAVIGVPDPEHGEEIEAHVVVKEGSALTEAELLQWCKEKMAAYKYPRRILFHPSLPLTATGKVLKRELKRQRLS